MSTLRTPDHLRDTLDLAEVLGGAIRMCESRSSAQNLQREAYKARRREGRWHDLEFCVRGTQLRIRRSYDRAKS